MADLIDRAATIKLFCDDCCKRRGVTEMCGDDDKCQDISVLKSVSAVNRWIPCGERLPESREGVIFTVDRGHPFVCVGYRINNERKGLQRWFDKLSGLNFSDYDVTAWRPMPDAYEPPEVKHDE